MDIHGPWHDAETMRCPHCGWPDAEPFEIVSRHQTPEGLTVWTRCGCGSLQVRVTDGVSARIVSRSRPTSSFAA